METVTLQGTHIRLEPLSFEHTDGLIAASAVNPELYKWTFVPQGREETLQFIRTALAGLNAGTTLPFAIVNAKDGSVQGSTRFWNIEYWNWPLGHSRYGKRTPDVCEIGHTWLAQSAIRTPVNTEAKLLLLTHAFEIWQASRVCFQTDVRNERSRAAIERIGARFEGVRRAERLGADNTVRDSALFSIIKSEWPEVKTNLITRLEK